MPRYTIGLVIGVCSKWACDPSSCRPPTTTRQEYKLLTASVHTGGISALNFDVSPVGKFVLFYNGVVAAYDFLVGGDGSKGPFDWEVYKSMRNSAAN